MRSREVLSNVYGIETGPLVTVRPFENERLSAASTGRSPTTIAWKAPTSGSKESTLRTDDFFTGNSPQVTGQNTFYLSGTNSKYYSGRLYSTWIGQFFDRAALFAC